MKGNLLPHKVKYVQLNTSS